MWRQSFLPPPPLSPFLLHISRSSLSQPSPQHSFGHPSAPRSSIDSSVRPFICSFSACVHCFCSRSFVHPFDHAFVHLCTRVVFIPLIASFLRFHALTRS